jgi:hypothetical protein
MQALLIEVRQLRRAVEHLSAVNGRVQIALQQLQMQEHRLSQASAQLNEIHKQGRKSRALMLDEASAVRRDIRGFGVLGSFSQRAPASTFC